MSYNVQLDEDEPTTFRADSLAQVCNALRGCASKRVRIWSSQGVLLVDTKFGDSYKLIVEQRRV